MMMPVEKKTESEDRAIAKRMLTMEFRTFVNNLMNIPVLVSETGRRIVLRFVSDSPWIKCLLRAQKILRQ